MFNFTTVVFDGTSPTFYLEAALLEKLWTVMQHRPSLRGGGRFTKAANDMFSPSLFLT